jgi:ribosomal protein L28
MLKKTCTIFILCFFCLKYISAQTTLSAGDILFTSYNSGPSAGTAPDTFSFVILAPIATNTVIYFTDRGFHGGTTWQGSGTTEGTISWTVGSALSIGKEVVIIGYTAAVNGTTNGTVAQVAGGNATTGLSLGNVGDQIMAFQGASGDPTSGSAFFICGMNWQFNCGTVSVAAWNGNSPTACSYGPQSSQMPPGLIGGTTALLTGDIATFSVGYTTFGRFECTNAPYANVASLKTALMNKTNWSFGASPSTTTVPSPAGCTFLQSSTTWTGSWSNGAPTSTVDAIIASSTAPASFTCKALTINSGVALTTTGITATVNGNITNSGNGIAGTGTVVIAANSTISGNALTIPSGGTLNLNSGTLTTGGLLRVGPGGRITGAYANISGTVTLQQSIIAQRGFRVFANPFSTAQTIATVASNNAITINTVASGASGLTDSRTHSNSTNNWSNVTGSTWAANTPYTLFIRGLASEVNGLNYSAGPTAFTYNVSGTLNGASINFTPSSSSNYMIMGNPYAAPVNTQALTGGVSRAYYTYQISQGGNQTAQRTKAGSWIVSGTNSDNTKTIPVLGILAYIPSSTTQFTVTAATDINTGGTLQTGLFRTLGNDDPTQVELSITQQGQLQDRLYIREDKNATANSTDAMDVAKFYNENVNFYTKTADQKDAAIDARKEFTQPIQIGITGTIGNYELTLNSNTIKNSTVVLKDKFLNTETTLKANEAYNYSITSEAASKGEQRFEINLQTKAIADTDNTTSTDFSAKVLNTIVTNGGELNIQVNSVKPATIQIFDMQGKRINTKAASNGMNRLNLQQAAKGTYIVQVTDGTNVVTEKVVKQ